MAVSQRHQLCLSSLHIVWIRFVSVPRKRDVVFCGGLSGGCSAPNQTLQISLSFPVRQILKLGCRWRTQESAASRSSSEYGSQSCGICHSSPGSHWPTQSITDWIRCSSSSLWLLAGSKNSVLKFGEAIDFPLSGFFTAEYAEYAELISEAPFRLLCVLCVNCVVGSGFQLTISRQLMHPPWSTMD